MPLAKRVVSPVRLSRKHVSEENKFDLGVVCNNTIAGTLQQLASLAYYADELFSELSQECIAVVRRSSTLVDKVQKIRQKVEDLDFRTVKIPTGDLKSFRDVTGHYKTEYGLDTLLFSPVTRPDCVIDLYEACALTPINTIRQCNGFRKDGRTGSKLFSLTPVVRDDALFGVESVVDIAEPLHYGDFERKPREPKSVKRRPRSLATLTELDNNVHRAEEGNLPPMEGADSPDGDRRLSASADLVAIDVTGTGFARMCEYRESMRGNSREYIEDETHNHGTRRRRHKHNRRQTVSGLPEQIPPNYGHGFTVQSQIDLRARSVSRERLERPKSMAYLDRYAPRRDGRKSREELRKDKDEEPGLARSCSLRRSMKSLFKADKEKSKSTDLWVEGRPRSPGPPMVEIDFPLRRSKSLPRSLKSISKSLSKLIHSRSASTEGRLDSKPEEEAKTKRSKTKTTTKQDQFFDQGYVTVVTNQKKKKGFVKGLSQRMSRSQSHMSSLGTSNSNINSRLPPKSPHGARPKHNDRPKSLEFGAVPTTTRGGRHSIPVCTPTTPSSDGVFTPGSENSSLGMKHRLNIPPGQAWKAFGGIKYRGTPPSGQDRHSSSGNWSASDSTARYSTESDYPQSNSSQERTSQMSERDSAVSFNMYGMDRHNTTTDNNVEDDTSTINGDISTTIDDASTLQEEDSDDTLNGSVVNVETNTKEMSDKWLNSLSRTKDTKEMKDRRRKRRSRKDRDGRTNNKGILDSPSGLTFNNLRAHDVAQNTNIRTRRSTGDESSVYSQDTDGFYTSMHIDSGLKSGLLADHSALNSSSGLTPVSSLFSVNSSRSSYYPPHTLHGVTVPITLHNNSSRNGVNSNGNHHKSVNGASKMPPAPPPRISTLSDKDNRYPSPRSSVHEEDELDRLLAASSSFSLNSTKSNDSKSRLSQTFSNSSTGINEFVVSESDTEVIYTRVKNKTNISSAGYPSLCSVTPLNSEDEDTEMLGFSSEWRSSFSNGNNSSIANGDRSLDINATSSQIPPLHLKSSTPIVSVFSGTGSGNKTPSSERNSFQGFKFNPILEVSQESSGPEKSDRSLDESGLSLEMDISGMDLIDTSIYSTWPRKLKNSSSNSSKNDNNEQYNSQDPQSDIGMKPSSTLPATYIRSLRLFNVGSLEELPNTRDVLPEVKTPDGVLDGDQRAISEFSNTFHIPSDQKFTFDFSDLCPLNKPYEQQQKTPDDKIPDVKVKSKSPSKVQFGELTVLAKPPSGRKLNLDSAVDYNTPEFTGTWPRKRNDKISSPKFIDDSLIETPKSPILFNKYELDEKSWTNSFPRSRKKNKKQCVVPKSIDFDQSFEYPPPELDKSHDYAYDLNQSYSNANDNTFDNSQDYSLPLPAQAKLIISSPVATKAEYRDNPHKRSMCSPVSGKDFVAFAQYSTNSLQGSQIVPAAVVPSSKSMDSFAQPAHVVKSNTMFEFQTVQPNESDGTAFTSSSAFKPVSKPLFPSLSAMKHSFSFPEPSKKSSADSSSYNRTWYDHANPYSSPVKTPSMTTPEGRSTMTEDRLSQTGYPFAAFLNDSFLSMLESGYDSKRQSIISTNSTSSSGSGKKSVTFASDLKTSQSSLNKSDTVSVGSNQTENSSNTSRTGLAGILTSFKKKSIESLKSIDSGKSSKSDNSVKLRNGKTIQVTVPKQSSTSSLSSRTSTLSLKSALSKKSSQSSLTPSVPSPDQCSLTTSPVKASLITSPPKLKRSSALLDEDFDFEDYAPENIINPELIRDNNQKTATREVSETMPDIVQHHAKRHCTAMVPRPKSTTGKVIMAKKTRLRKAPSKSSVTVVVNADSCEVVSMPMKENKTPNLDFTTNEKPFSSIIMDSAPSKVTVTTAFDLTPNEKSNSIFGIDTEKPKVPVVINAGPAKTSRIVNNSSSIKAPGAVVNLLNEGNVPLNDNSKCMSLPRMGNSFTNYAKTMDISDISDKSAICDKMAKKTSTANITLNQINPVHNQINPVQNKTNPVATTQEGKNTTDRKTFTSFAALKSDHDNKTIGKESNVKTNVSSPSVVKPDNQSKIPVVVKLNSNPSKIPVVSNKSNISAKSGDESTKNSDVSTKNSDVITKTSDVSTESCDVNTKTGDKSTSASRSSINGKSDTKQLPKSEAVIKSSSAFNDVLSDSTNKIKPIPPRFTLPKLNTLQSTTEKNRTKNTSTSNLNEVKNENSNLSKISVESKSHGIKSSVSKASEESQSTAPKSILSIVSSKSSGDSNSGNNTIISKASTESNNNKNGDRSKLSNVSTKSNNINDKSAINTTTTSSRVVNSKPPLNRSVSSDVNLKKQPANTSSKLTPQLSLTNSTSQINGIEPGSSRSSAYPYSGSTTSLHQGTNNGSCKNNLGQSSVLTKSLSNLSCLSLLRTESSFSLSQSSYSLARSTDSLASTSSINAEKTRSAKLAFLEQQQTESKSTQSQQPSLDNRFAKYTLGLKKLSESKTSLNSYKSNGNLCPESESSHSLSSSSSNNNEVIDSLNTKDNYSNNSNKTVWLNGQASDKNSNNLPITNSKDKLNDKIATVNNNQTEDNKEKGTNLNSSLSANINKKSTTVSDLSKAKSAKTATDNSKGSPSQGNIVSSLIGKFQK